MRHGHDRPVLGILFMLGFCTLAPLADSFAKILGASLPIMQLVLARFGFQVVVLLPMALFAGSALIWSRQVTGLVAARTALHIVGIGAMFLALRYMPLADAIAIAFVMPFILLLLGWFFLGEEVGWRRIAASLVGFIGTLFVIKPSFAAVGAPALLPLIVAVVFACFMLVTRRIARETDPVALQATSGVMAVILLAPLVWIFERSGLPALAWPDAAQIWQLVALGVLGTAAHLVMTWSLRFAPASTLAPMQYLEIPVAACFGWLIFREFPDGLALFGIAITISAGLFIVLRERALSRASAPPTMPPAPPAA
jgi:drug/metabolite transporter (DMT)-like permease